MSLRSIQLIAPEIRKHRLSASLGDALWSLIQRLFAAVLLIVMAPLLAILLVLVKATSPGPFLFRQKRCGYRGRPFSIVKIRTMTVGSEKNAAFGLAVDNAAPEVTAVGRVLRELKLDELPQLWNVVRGDMALVGPRAIAMNLDEMLRREIPGFERRYGVKPGLTNLAQISILDNSRGDALVKDWSARFAAEMQYVRTRCASVDILMICMTAAFVLRKLAMSIRGGRPAGMPAMARAH